MGQQKGLHSMPLDLQPSPIAVCAAKSQQQPCPGGQPVQMKAIAAFLAVCVVLAASQAAAAPKRLGKGPYAIGQWASVGYSWPGCEALAPCHPPVAARPVPFPAAHRGLSGVYPEHTIRAYQAAIDVGADFIECDGKPPARPPRLPADCLGRQPAGPPARPANASSPCLPAVVPTKDCQLICRHEPDLRWVRRPPHLTSALCNQPDITLA